MPHALCLVRCSELIKHPLLAAAQLAVSPHGLSHPCKTSASTKLQRVDVDGRSPVQRSHRLSLFFCKVQQFLEHQHFSDCCAPLVDFQSAETTVLANFVQVYTFFGGEILLTLSSQIRKFHWTFLSGLPCLSRNITVCNLYLIIFSGKNPKL